MAEKTQEQEQDLMRAAVEAEKKAIVLERQAAEFRRASADAWEALKRTLRGEAPDEEEDMPLPGTPSGAVLGTILGTMAADAIAPYEGEEERKEPKVGEELTHMSRGRVRAKCTYMGRYDVRFQGKSYTSLSAAAKAAAEHLGMAAHNLDGRLFWGLKRRRQGGLPNQVAAAREERRQRLAQVVDSTRTKNRR